MTKNKVTYLDSTDVLQRDRNPLEGTWKTLQVDVGWGRIQFPWVLSKISNSPNLPMALNWNRTVVLKNCFPQQTDWMQMGGILKAFSLSPTISTLKNIWTKNTDLAELSKVSVSEAESGAHQCFSVCDEAHQHRDILKGQFEMQLFTIMSPICWVSFPEPGFWKSVGGFAHTQDDHSSLVNRRERFVYHPYSFVNNLKGLDFTLNCNCLLDLLISIGEWWIISENQLNTQIQRKYKNKSIGFS